MNPGMFKNRIDILRPVPVEDELGQEDIDWELHKSIWAAVKTIQGKEYFAAGTDRSEYTMRFIVRYVPDIDSTMRVLFKNRTLEIVSVINDDEANKTLTIIVKEGGQNE